jgi:putative transposase
VKGPVYQGRYKSFPVQSDEHFHTLCRYVERNALRAGLVEHAELWRSGSLWRRLQAIDPDPKLLSPWPIPRLSNWVDQVNAALSEKDLEAIRHCVRRGRPLGDRDWIESTVKRLNLESTLRPRGGQRLESSKAKTEKS